jgi:N,N-dimethylformamidase
VGALAGYPVLATLSHPEYYSEAMMNGIMAFQNAGGRHLALGANGFYWRCAFHPKAPAAVEVRRGMTGTRTWESRPGEVNLAGTGEPAARCGATAASRRRSSSAWALRPWCTTTRATTC